MADSTPSSGRRTSIDVKHQGNGKTYAVPVDTPLSVELVFGFRTDGSVPLERVVERIMEALRSAEDGFSVSERPPFWQTWLPEEVTR